LTLSSGFAEALAPYARRHFLMSPAVVIGRLEQFGVDLAELAADLPARLNRISEAIATGGFEIHVRADEMDALLARTERLGNRVAASVLAAALIDVLVELASRQRRRRRRLGPARGTPSGRLQAFVWPLRRRR
jgi:ubiquinone biosynthesis protein